MKTKASSKIISITSILLLSLNYAQAEGTSNQSIDTFFPFSWMEDACLGDTRAYSFIKEMNHELTNSIIGMRDTPIVNDYDDGYEYYVKPSSEWAFDFDEIVEDIKIEINSEYTEYHVKFKNNVSYRGEPLSEYQYKFRPESEGGEHVLKFKNTADTNYLLSEFKGRMVEDWVDGRMYESKAKYDKLNKTFTCHF